jgi:hypothetical protein
LVVGLRGELVLGILTARVGVAASRGPPVDRHQPVPGVPLDEDGLVDAQAEHDRLIRRPRGPPCFRRAVAMVVADLNGCSGQLEFSLAAVGAGHRAVQHIPRIAPQVGCDVNAEPAARQLL